MQRSDPGEVVLEQRRQSGGKGCEPILVALARTDGELLHLEIDVFDPEPDAFHDAQAAAVKKLGDQLGGSVQQGNDTGDFFACHDHGDIDLFWGTNGIDSALHGLVEDSLVKEHQGIHRLAPGGRGDICVYGQVGEERLDFGLRREEVVAGPHLVEADVANHPIHIGSFGVNRNILLK